MAVDYLGNSESCDVYMINGRLSIERKIHTITQDVILKCLNNGTMWNSKIFDTIHGDEYLSSGTFEKMSSGIEKKIGIKILSRENLEKMLTNYYIGPK